MAQCYTNCMSGWQRADTARLALDALDGEWSDVAVQYVGCLLAQIDAVRADACRSGCVDIEIAYGVRSSYIRTRFMWALNKHLRDGPHRPSMDGMEPLSTIRHRRFHQACARYIQILESKNAQVVQGMQDVKPLSEAELRVKREEVIANEHYPEPPPAWESWD